MESMGHSQGNVGLSTGPGCGMSRSNETILLGGSVRGENLMQFRARKVSRLNSPATDASGSQILTDQSVLSINKKFE